MGTAAYEVAQVLQQHKNNLRDYCSTSWQYRTLHQIRKCRTVALGGHIDQCNNPDCQRLHLSYNSCRNRHCPKCQGHQKERWVRAREAELLPVPYFHVVFTLPHELNRLCLYRPRVLYAILFKVAWQVIQGFGNSPKFLGAQTGMIAVLHTWGQNLSLHPHLHCIVPGGGLSRSGKWKPIKQQGRPGSRNARYLFPVKAMGKVFRARFVAQLRKELERTAPDLYDTLFAKDWVVYCKRPFLGPEQVVEYLGRYTHKIAIGNHRLQAMDKDKVLFSAKDYRHGGKRCTLELGQAEFIRRFALHVLPKGFVRIRHYGMLSTYHKRVNLKKLKATLAPVRLKERPPILHRKCPKCLKGNLMALSVFTARGPPKYWLEKLHRSQIR